MEKSKEYYAFISYKREDEKWAKWLQDKLEHYKFPTNLNGRSDLPKKIYPTCRDVTDFSPEPLEQAIKNALCNSQWLIVVCSPRAAKSPWVCKEAQTFINLGRADHIIPFVIEGTPFSNDTATECYPEALLHLTGSQELLATNINEMGRDAAAVKIVARMFGLKFDTLWQRYEREQKKKKYIKYIIIILLLMITAFLALFYINHKKILFSQSQLYAEKAFQVADEGDSYLARVLALKAWDYSQTPEAECVLRSVSRYNNAILKGHTGSVSSVAICPNPKCYVIASASSDSTIILWYRTDGRKINILKGHTGCVNSVAFHPDTSSWDNTLLISSSDDSTVRIWNAKTGKTLKILRGHTEGVVYATYSPDGSLIASASRDNNIRIWDAETGDSLKTLRGHSSIVNSVIFSPDGKKIASASNDRTVRIWDVRTGVCIDTLKGYHYGVYSLSFKPDGSKIVASSYDSNILVWDVNTGKPTDTLRLNTPRHVFSVAYNTDGSLILTASDDGLIRVWNSEGTTSNPFKVIACDTTKVLYGHKGAVNCAVFNANGSFIASASTDGTIRLWDDEYEKWSHLISGVSIAKITYASFGPDGKIFALCDNGSHIHLRSAESGIYIKVIDGHTGGLNSVLFSSDGKKLLSASNDMTIRIWDVQSGNGIQTLKGHIDAVRSAVFSSDDKYVASASDDETIRIWNSETGECLLTLSDQHKGAINSVAISPNDKYVISASTDKTICIWDIKTGALIKKLLGHESAVNSVSISPNGKYLASASNDQTARVWDFESGCCLHVLDGHSNVVRSVSFSNDGKFIVTASFDKTVRIWDVKTGKQIQILKCASDNYPFAVFSPDGNRILSNDGDVQIRIDYFYQSYQDLIDSTRKRFKNRPLTPEERRKYYLE